MTSQTIGTPEEHLAARLELFDGRSQLLVYHFMFAPDWEAGCPAARCGRTALTGSSFT